ncbi:MAG TPA: sialidase family protein [Edaphobacter sp.]|nr:sialidase family protein [Edaphobacter sp.]
MRNLRRTLTSFLALSLIALPALAATVSGAFTPVFTNGNDGYKCFRIPAIVATPAGALLAFAEGRRNGCNDFGNIQIVMRISRNQGKTWGPLEIIARNSDLQTGNPVPVVDTMDNRYPKGRVLLVYNTGNASETAVREGKGTRRVWYVASTDDGETWSAPVEITSSVKLPTWRSYATGPGHGLLLHNGFHAGRIVIAANHSEAGAHSASETMAHAFFSDDHGSTWHLGDTLDVPGSNESTAAEADDGAVVMNSRDQSGSSHARIIASSNSGAEHWDRHFIAYDLPDPICQGSMLRYAPKKGKPALLFSNAGSTTDRVNLTISVSRDGGLTWPRHTLIYTGPSAYSDIVLMRHGKVGILWEHGSDSGIGFTTRKIKSLF